MKTIEIYGSSGSFNVNAETGEVIDRNHKVDDNDYKSIIKVDLQEFRNHYKTEELPDSIDILDLGLFLQNGTYDEPVHDWRSEARELDNEKA